MVVTGLNFKFMFITSVSDHSLEFEIPLTGDDKVITQINRCSYETVIKKYPLPDETCEEFSALLGKYGITDWIGRTPSLPKVAGEGDSIQVAFLILKAEDGSEHKITFREVEDSVGQEAASEFRKLTYGSAKEELLISEERVYPNLEECRKIKEEHGPVVAVETHHFSSGMMYNSNVTTKQLVEKIPDREGVVLVTYKKQAGQQPEKSVSKETESDIIARVQELSDKENFPSWEYICRDPSIPVDMSMIPTDYSASSSVSIYYDDSLITGCPRIKRTIGSRAFYDKESEVEAALSQMVCDCVNKAELRELLPDPSSFIPAPCDPVQPSMSPFLGMGMGNITPQIDLQAVHQQQKDAAEQRINAMADNKDGWTCKACGQTGLTGKFCYNCGNPRD